jgi:hypothetical protein
MIAGRIEMTPDVVAKLYTPTALEKMAATKRRKIATGEIDMSNAIAASHTPASRAKLSATVRRKIATGEFDTSKAVAAMHTPVALARGVATKRLIKLLATIGNDWSDKARAFNEHNMAIAA